MMVSMKNETTAAMFDAAKKIGSGEDVHAHVTMPSPRNPTAEQKIILRAIEAFQMGRQCAGWDLLDEVETFVTAAWR